MILFDNRIDELIVGPEISVQDSMARLSSVGQGILFVAGEHRALLGSVSDGDIRRALLSGARLDEPIANVMNRSPLSVPETSTDDELDRLCAECKQSIMPIVDRKRALVGVARHVESEPFAPTNTSVVLMVGGEGSRLAPLTDNVPKPLLHVGDRPILQTILEKLQRSGFRNVYLCVRYRAQMIRDFCGDGRRFGLRIDYVEEEKKLGTIGAVKFLERELTPAFLVMNGDLLTKLNFRYILNFHQHEGSDITVGTRDHEVTFPYGTFQLDGVEVRELVEKPKILFKINAGIYVLSRAVLRHIPFNEYFDVTDLILKVKEIGQRVVAFPIPEYWLDIGRHDDYHRANQEFTDRFGDPKERS